MKSDLQDRVIELEPPWPITMNVHGMYEFKQAVFDAGQTRELTISLRHHARLSYFLTFINGNYYAYWDFDTVLFQCVYTELIEAIK
jgi:hypothetical protein